MRNPASSTQGTGFPVQEARAVEDDRDIFHRGTLAEGGNELVAVHGGHQDVGDDEIRLSEPRLVQPLSPIACFNDLMPDGRQQGGVELATVNVIVNHEDQCHRNFLLPRKCAPDISNDLTSIDTPLSLLFLIRINTPAANTAAESSGPSKKKAVEHYFATRINT